MNLKKQDLRQNNNLLARRPPEPTHKPRNRHKGNVLLVYNAINSWLWRHETDKQWRAPRLRIYYVLWNNCVCICYKHVLRDYQ